MSTAREPVLLKRYTNWLVAKLKLGEQLSESS